MIVDFHVHSTASDGTLSPTELAAKGRAFAAMALTDHDNGDGLDEFLSATDGCPRRIAGVELSIEPGAGFDKFHLLALGVNPKDPGFRTFLHRVLVERDARNARILANFRRLGIDMEGTIAAYAHGEVLARPHFAQWLMDRGFVASVAEAFEKYLLPESPDATRCYEERWHPPRAETFAIVHAAGGICVMAHPKYWRREWKRVGCDFAAAERGLGELREMGLDGVEALYQANTAEENVAFVRLATRLGFLLSAGSDFHGATKPHITLGMEVSESYIRPLLDRISDF